MAVLDLKSISGFRSVLAGHAIELEVQLADGSVETIRCDAHLAPRLSQAVIQASMDAERQRRGGPQSDTVLEVPYLATDCKTGVTTDGKYVALGFATASGPPVLIAMPENLATRTIESLEAELARLNSHRPPQTS